MIWKRRELLVWLTVILVIFGHVIIIVIMSKNKASGIEIIGWVTGAGIPTIGFLNELIQKRSLRYFLISHRLRSLLSNRSPAWNITALFKGKNITEETIDEVIKTILSKRKNVSVKDINSITKHVIVPSGPTLEITYNRPVPSGRDDLGNQPAAIQVFIRNYRVGYRQATHAIQKEIIPLLEDISGVIQAVEAVYSMTVEFDKNYNPFFGLYIAHFDPKIVSSFFVRLKIDEYEPNDTVLVSSDKIAINAYSQNALQNLALEFLTFDMRLEERFNSGK